MKKIIVNFSKWTSKTPSLMSLIVLGFLFVLSCKKEIINQNALDVDTSKLSEKFKDYRIVTLNASQIFEQAKNADNQSFDLQIENGFTEKPWNVTIQRSDVLSEKTEYYTTANGINTNQNLDFRSFQTLDESKQGSFVLSDELLGGSFISENEERYHIYKEIDVIGEEGDCDNISNTNSMTNQPTDLNFSTQDRMPTCWKIEVRAEGDYPYFQNKNSSINTATLAITLNLTNSSAQFKPIGYNIVVLSVGIYNAAPSAGWGYTGVDASSILTQMNNHWIPYYYMNRDLNILYTGKNIHSGGNYSVNGKAMALGQICINQNKSYCIAEGAGYSNASMARLTSHEIGHLFNAQHTTSGIMVTCPTCSSTPSSFSTVSKDHINYHVWFNNSCLTQGECL
jgi:hypothetical protein